MIDVATAEKFILENLRPLESEKISIFESLGRILDQDIKADRDFPPFDRVMMDGIAFSFDALSASKTFQIEKTIAAGMPQSRLEDAHHCIEIMTGAMLPLGCDTVVKYEDLTLKDGTATIAFENIKQGQNIHKQGSDRKAGDVIIHKNKKISAAEIGVMAAVGQAEIVVKRKPKVIIVSTGDELVSITEMPLPHQIRSSNGHAIQAALTAAGAIAVYHHLPDEQAIIASHLKTFLQEADAIVLSGGVSAGKFDFVPMALKNEGVAPLFHQVSQRPGKPLWFGVSPGGVAVFALPGNPVSTFMCLHRYVLPWIAASTFQGSSVETVILAQKHLFQPPLTHFLQVKINIENGLKMAWPVAGNGSGDLANLVDADGFVELPKTQDVFDTGEVLAFYPYR